MLKKVGDFVGGSGVVEISDILKLIEGFQNKIPKTDPIWKSLDLNSDGVIDITDILAIINLSIYSQYRPFTNEITFADFAIKPIEAENKVIFQVNMKKFDDDIHGIQMYVSGVQLKPHITQQDYISNKNTRLANWIVASNTLQKKGVNGANKSISLIYLEENNSGLSKLTKDDEIIDLCTIECDAIDTTFDQIKFYSSANDYQSYVVKADGDAVIEKDFRVILS